MNEHKEENGIVNLDDLRTGFIPNDDYVIVHKGLVIPCHDVAVEYGGGVLLVERDMVPAKGMVFVFGGRIERGYLIEESLKRRVYNESNLELYNPTFLGVSRTFWKTDPFGHGKGTDTINFMYYAKAKGEIRLDSLHKGSFILKPNDYTEEFREGLHPYMQEILDLAMPYVGK